MDIAVKILSSHFPQEQWHIKKPPAGLSKESYIATNEKRKIFLKFDVDTPALERLVEISVTPCVFLSDTFQNRPYIVQEFMQGQYPDKEWFQNNLPILAQFIKSCYAILSFP